VCRLTAVLATIFIAITAMANADLVDEESEHPIPRLSVIDVQGVRKGGGSDLNLVIATPLMADEHSKQRLLQKLDNYVRAVSSSGYSAQYGEPTPSNTSIVVHIHPKSHPDVFRLLEKYRPKVAAAGASFQVKPLEVPK
jgi:hypothetical protein